MNASADSTTAPKSELVAALLTTVRGKCLVSEITCYQCSGKGHYKLDCPSKGGKSMVSLRRCADTMTPEEVCWMYGCQVPVHMGAQNMRTRGYIQKGMCGHTPVKYYIAYMYSPHTFVTQPTMSIRCLSFPVS